jgi:hypothetical protein
MALRDLEAFIRQAAAAFDPNLDTNPGSPYDSKVIQPIIRRIGPDPFSVDMQTFIDARLRQAYPDMAIGDGDGITDLLSKPASLLWDPIVREVARTARSKSFQDPNTLTTEEADALGANLFAERSQGDFARGTARVLFAQAQSVSVSPVNFVTARSGLRFFPTESQAIRIEEMLLNIDENGLFYFDITVVAEAAGSSYNIGPKELVSIANLDAAVQVLNLRKFETGDDPQTAAEFIDKTRQELTERSLVTIRGIASKITGAFPEVSRLNVVGFNDPEMQRDLIVGGGLGPVLSAGVLGATVSDLVGAAFTRRFSSSEVDFTVVIGPPGTVPVGFVLTVFGAFGTASVVRDLSVLRVVSATVIEVETQELVYGLSDLRWSIRKTELTLSGIPGGILFPDGVLGTVAIPNDAIHIGGSVDTHVRGASFDESVLVVDNLTDDSNELEGLTFDFDDGDDTLGTITELVIGVDYVSGDETFLLLERAGRDSLTLQIVNGTNAGVYRILAVDQTGASPVVTVTPAFTSAVAASARWRIFDDVDIALYDIKETRIEGTDLSTTQNFDVVSTAGAVDFDAVGVSEGDVLRIRNGPDAGDYAITEDPLAPGFTSLRVDASFTSSQSALSYIIFRPNAAGDVTLPLVRIRSVELLDSSSQPIGTSIPYARPVDVQSNAFQNPARGVKHDITDAVLGLVSQPEPLGGFAVGGLTFSLVTPSGTVTFAFSAGPLLALATVISELNAAILAQVGEPQAALQVGADRFGIRPFGTGGLITTSGVDATVVALFGGTDEQRTSGDIRSVTIDADGGWSAIQPFIDLATGLDVVQLLDGNQVGFVPGPYVPLPQAAVAPAVNGSTALQATSGQVFFPESGVRLQVGARSIGSARVFFLDPTSFEVRSGVTFFEVQTAAGLIRFTPDPTLDAQRIPALPGGTKPTDGVSADSSTIFTSASQDFILSSIRAGDKVVVDYHPIAGDVVLADPVPGLVNQTLIFSVDGSPDKTLVFIRDDVTLATTEVSRQGVADQINAAAGVDIASITASNTLEFEADAAIVIRGTGTANATILGGLAGTAATFVGVGNNQRNTAPHAGEHIIASVDSQTQVTFTAVPVNGTLFSTPFTRQQFKVFRAGVQRISTSQMKLQTAEAGLYYMDVELVSEGTGDLWNLDAGEQLTASGFKSDGYFLTTEDSNLTFSVIERPRMSISKTILEDGVDDDPANATQVAGQNIQITYDRATLVEDVQNFISSETERVVNSSPLARHLIPHFVRFDLTYVGGSKEEVVVPDVEDYITKLAPAEALESSDLQKIVSDAGATSITNPLDLIAIVHNVDRSITAARSQNRLTTGRLAAFIPDLLNIKRNIT